MRLLLIVNATASSVTARRRVVIRKALSADHQVELVETSRRGHATRLARSAALEGFDCVVVLAGDGTLNEAADGLAGSATALAPLPGGSTNVFARTLGVPGDAVEATGQLLSSLERRSFRRVGLGSVNGRHFLFHTGVGFDAAVVARVERRGSGIKRYAAHPLFVAATFETWFRGYDHRNPAFRVELPDGEVIEDGYFAVVSNTSPYTYLGSRPLVLAPDAGLDRPLGLTVFRTLRLPVMLSLAASALASGRRLVHHGAVAYRSDLTGLTISGYRPVPYQVDGDHLGEAEHLSFVYEPDALNLVVP